MGGGAEERRMGRAGVKALDSTRPAGGVKVAARIATKPDSRFQFVKFLAALDLDERRPYDA